MQIAIKNNPLIHPPFIKSSPFILALALAIGVFPMRGMAQRFNHGGFHPAPAPRPAAPAARPAPAMRPAPAARPEARPPEVRQPEVRQPEPARPTINGGVQNYGNHDFSRPAQVHPNANVHANVNIRENVNVYHTGGYRGFHPYYYHPYRPYYWGPHWHPVGFFLTALATDAIWFNWNNQRYYYDDGCFYLPGNGGYSVVPPPIGAVVPSLPPGYETTMVGNDTYYYFGGAFYIDNGQGYEVVAAPPGAVITELPVGAVEQDTNGETLMVYNNTYFLPISQDGQDAYEVVTP